MTAMRSISLWPEMTEVHQEHGRKEALYHQSLNMNVHYILICFLFRSFTLFCTTSSQAITTTTTTKSTTTKTTKSTTTTTKSTTPTTTTTKSTTTTTKSTTPTTTKDSSTGSFTSSSSSTETTWQPETASSAGVVLSVSLILTVIVIISSVAVLIIYRRRFRNLKECTVEITHDDVKETNQAYDKIKEDIHCGPPPVKVSTVYDCVKYTDTNGAESTDEISSATATAPCTENQSEHNSSNIIYTSVKFLNGPDSSLHRNPGGQTDNVAKSAPWIEVDYDNYSKDPSPPLCFSADTHHELQMNPRDSDLEDGLSSTARPLGKSETREQCH